MAKFNVVFKNSALRQLRSFPSSIQPKILDAISVRLVEKPFLADGKHIKKLTDGYRLRVGDYRVFYYIESQAVTITSVVRRTSTTY